MNKGDFQTAEGLLCIEHSSIILSGMEVSLHDTLVGIAKTCGQLASNYDSTARREAIYLLDDVDEYVQYARLILRLVKRRMDGVEQLNYARQQKTEAEAELAKLEEEAKNPAPAATGFFASMKSKLTSDLPTRIRKLQDSLVALTEECDRLERMVEEASDKFGAEMDYFERNKVADFSRFLDEWISARVDFHTQAARHWQDLRFALRRSEDTSTEVSNQAWDVPRHTADVIRSTSRSTATPASASPRRGATAPGTPSGSPLQDEGYSLFASSPDREHNSVDMESLTLSTSDEDDGEAQRPSHGRQVSLDPARYSAFGEHIPEDQEALLALSES